MNFSAKRLNNLNEMINNDANGNNLMPGSLKSDMHELVCRNMDIKH